MILNDFALYTPRPLTDEGRELENKTQAIFIALVKKLKRNVKTDGFRKINVMINSQSPNKYTCALSVLSYHISEFDIGSILNRDLNEQQNLILNLGVDVLKDVFDKYSLHGASLDDIKNTIEDEGFINIYSGPISEFDGVRARIKAVQNFDRTSVTVEVKKNRKILKEKELFILESTNPFIFQAYLKKLDWIDPGRLKLSVLNGDEHVIEI